MKREELVARTRQLVEEGERIVANPSLAALRVWLQLSDDLLAAAWGTMDRYHLAWLMVGKPKGAVRGRPMTPAEEAAYVREVAAQKVAALRMSLKAAEEGMPFVGEGRESGDRDGTEAAGPTAEGTAGARAGVGEAALRPHAPGPRPAERPAASESPPADGRPPADRPEVEAARRRAEAHRQHERRAPRPDRMLR